MDNFEGKKKKNLYEKKLPKWKHLFQYFKMQRLITYFRMSFK